MNAVSSPEKTFPDFIIPGAAKSGTTALCSWLRTHPEVHIPEPELNFYSLIGRPHRRPSTMPQPQFPDLETYLAALRSGEPSGSAEPRTRRVIGEKSVSYLYPGCVDGTIDNIRRLHPRWRTLKIVVLLRDPVERAYSHYVSNLRLGLESLALPSAVERWGDRERRGLPFWFDYLGFSRYSGALAKFLRHFRRTRIYFFDDLVARPQATVADIFRFLDVDPGWRPPNVGRNPNPSLVPRSAVRVRLHERARSSSVCRRLCEMLPVRFRDPFFGHARRWAYERPPPLPPEVRRELLAGCIDDLRELERLLDRRLPCAWFEPCGRIEERPRRKASTAF
jgi:hypothetical protein